MVVRKISIFMLPLDYMDIVVVGVKEFITTVALNVSMKLLNVT